MGHLWLAIRAFFTILFQGRLPADAMEKLGLRAEPQPAAAPARAPEAGPSDGALQILAILQRDSRLLDFLMEDISGYADDQIGAAVRTLHDQACESLGRYLRLAPVIDGVEGSFTRLEAFGGVARDVSAVKFLGNVPAQGRPEGGVLRHKGWRAEKIDLPPLPAQQDVRILAPAELEVE